MNILLGPGILRRTSSRNTTKSSIQILFSVLWYPQILPHRSVAATTATALKPRDFLNSAGYSQWALCQIFIFVRLRLNTASSANRTTLSWSNNSNMRGKASSLPFFCLSNCEGVRVILTFITLYCTWCCLNSVLIWLEEIFLPGNWRSNSVLRAFSGKKNCFSNCDFWTRNCTI